MLNKTLIKSVAFTLLAIAVINRVGALAPVKNMIEGK